MGPQSCKSPNFGNFGTPNLGVLGQNDIRVLALWPNRKYYKGKGDGFPQVWAMVSRMSPCLPMICLCTKNAPTMH